MKTAFILVVLLIGSMAATGLAGGFGEPTTEVDGLRIGGPVATIDHDADLSYTIIEAEVENTGFETFFVALPLDWAFDPEIYGATGEPIIATKGALHKKYGDPGDKSSFIRNNYVFEAWGGLAVSRGSPWVLTMSGGEDDGGVSYGWSVRPNERLKFTIKMKPSDSEAIIDPLAIERNRTDIKVIKWNQEMVIYPESGETGFISAPWIVKGATMVEATPGVFTNISEFTQDIYWFKTRLQNATVKSTGEETEPEVSSEPTVELNPPEWDAWFSSSGFFGLESKSLAPLSTELLPIPEVNKTEPIVEEVEETGESVFIPVWLIDPEFYQSNSVGTTSGAAIRYVYEWRRGKEIKGVDAHLFSKPFKTNTEIYGDVTPTPVPTEAPVGSEEKSELDLTIVPEWYTWFN
ncbi:MAG TPA: hypothetical protein ENH51_01975 [Euryarchaeota archaeon]|nr:hypothetical protein [Euryarchaeota archaeon]